MTPSLLQSSLDLTLALMVTQGVLGAIDTLYYHEWRYRLCAHPEHSALELKLHGARDLIYAILFICLPRWSWCGVWAGILALALLSEIVITLIDFVIERRVRSPWGGLAAGELMMHAVMAIIYGAFLLSLTPHLITWWSAPTGLTPHAIAQPDWVLGVTTLMGCGVGLAGLRDLAVSFGASHLSWPWRAQEPIKRV